MILSVCGGNHMRSLHGKGETKEDSQNEAPAFFAAFNVFGLYYFHFRSNVLTSNSLFFHTWIKKILTLPGLGIL
jgi:hypothetical protein